MTHQSTPVGSGPNLPPETPVLPTDPVGFGQPGDKAPMPRMEQAGPDWDDLDGHDDHPCDDEDAQGMEYQGDSDEEDTEGMDDDAPYDDQDAAEAEDDADGDSDPDASFSCSWN